MKLVSAPNAPTSQEIRKLSVEGRKFFIAHSGHLPRNIYTLRVTNEEY